jgi:hypothetical protein
MSNKVNKYDIPTITPDLSEDEILDLFVHNEQFAMFWLRLMVTKNRGLNMPIEQHRKIIHALRSYITMLSTMLAGTELLLEIVDEPIPNQI